MWATAFEGSNPSLSASDILKSMKLTKYEHACLDITIDDTRIVVDPGIFSTSFTNYSQISVVVITHIHPDHYSPDVLRAIIKVNPSIQVFVTKEISDDFKDGHLVVPEIDKEYKLGDLILEFFGREHAVIDPEASVNQNIGVLINNQLYYPGDSFTECNKEFDVLAVPASAPWMKVSNVIPLLKNSKCSIVFPTHNALLSDIGTTITNNNLQKFTERYHKEFRYLSPMDSIEI